MKRDDWALLVAVLLVAAFGLGCIVGQRRPTALTPKLNDVQTIYVRNVSSFVSDSEVKNALPAINAATHDDFAPLWKVDANLVFIGSAKAPVGASTITLVDKGPVKGALAYHEVTNGVPDSIVYVATSRYYGYAWSVGLTHELWEQLADVPAGAGSVDTVQSTDGTIWAKEIADPVESDADAYARTGADGKPVLISDFVTEKWFGALVAGPYDFANHIQQPLQIDKGGYAQWWDGAGWNVIDNFRSDRDRGFLLGDPV